MAPPDYAGRGDADVNASNETTNPRTILAALDRASVCAGLAHADRAHLARLAERREYAPGEWLFHEATPRRWLGVVERGEVELVRGSGGREQRAALLGPGDLLSGGVLLDDLPHAASARTPGGAAVIQFRRSRVAALRTEHPTLFYRLASKVALSISERMRAAAEELARAADFPPRPEPTERVEDGTCAS